MPADPAPCLECHRHLAIRWRLCAGCYSTLGKLVRAGGATWQQLEQAGRCRAAVGTPWRKQHDGEANQ